MELSSSFFDWVGEVPSMLSCVTAKTFLLDELGQDTGRRGCTTVQRRGLWRGLEETAIRKTVESDDYLLRAPDSLRREMLVSALLVSNIKQSVRVRAAT